MQIYLFKLNLRKKMDAQEPESILEIGISIFFINYNFVECRRDSKQFNSALILCRADDLSASKLSSCRSYFLPIPCKDQNRPNVWSFPCIYTSLRWERYFFRCLTGIISLFPLCVFTKQTTFKCFLFSHLS